MTSLQIQVLATSIVALIVYVFHIIFIHLPAKQQQLLEHAAHQAVQMVQQVSSDIPDAQKKTLALNTVKILFKAFGGIVPMPSDIILNTAIEAAVFAMKQQVKVPPATPAVPASSSVVPQYLGQNIEMKQQGGSQ